MAIYSGFSHEKWWFSIAMLVYQRVPGVRIVATNFVDKLRYESSFIVELCVAEAATPGYGGWALQRWID